MTNLGQALLVPGRGSGGGLPVTSGLVAWYSADKITGVANGGAVAAWPDSSGNGNTASQGTTANKPIYSATGGRNGAATTTFNGTSDSLLVSILSSVGFPHGSIVAWANVTAPASAQSYLLSVAANSLVLGVDTTGKLFGQVFDGANKTKLGVTAITGGWHVLGITADGASATLYVDGVADASVAAGSINWFSSTALTIGKSTGGSTSFVNGSFSGGVVYNRALAATEMASLAGWWP